MKFIILFLWIATVMCDVSITAPKTGQSYSGKSGTVSIDVKWDDSTDDSDDQFSLSNAQSYTISLCTGPSTSIECFDAVLDSKSLDDKSYTAEFDNTVADDGYYFFQIYVVFPESASTIHYTNIFELTDMKGSTATLTVSNTYTGTAPAPQTNGGDATSINSKSFTVPYTLQTGKTRYAPMQTQPGTKVSKSSWSRKFPTSAVTYYTSPTPSPVCLSTITPGWSYSVTSAINYASAAPTPSQKYDPAERVTKASLSSAHKARRWLD